MTKENQNSKLRKCNTSGNQQGHSEVPIMDCKQHKSSSSEDTELEDQSINEAIEAGSSLNEDKPQVYLTLESVLDIWNYQTESLAVDPKFIELGKKFEEAIFKKIVGAFDDIGSISAEDFVEPLIEIASQDETVIRMIGRRRQHRMPLPEVINTLIKNYVEKVAKALKEIEGYRAFQQCFEEDIFYTSSDPVTSKLSVKQKPILMSLGFVKKIWQLEIKPPAHDRKFDELGKKLTEEICRRVTDACNGIKSDAHFFKILCSIALEDESVKETMNKNNVKRDSSFGENLVMEYLKRAKYLTDEIVFRCSVVNCEASESLFGSAISQSEQLPSRGAPSLSTSSSTIEQNQATPPVTEKSGTLDHIKPATTDLVRKIWNEHMEHMAHDPRFEALSEKFQKIVFMRVSKEWNSEQVGSSLGLVQLMHRLASQDENVKKMIAEGKEVLDRTTGSPMVVTKYINSFFGIMVSIQKMKKRFDSEVSDAFHAALKCSDGPFIRSATFKIRVTCQFVGKVWSNTIKAPAYHLKFRKLAKKLENEMFLIAANFINRPGLELDRKGLERLLCVAVEDEIPRLMKTNRREPVHHETGLPLKVFNLIENYAAMMNRLIRKVEDQIKFEDEPCALNLEAQEGPKIPVSYDSDASEVSENKPESTEDASKESATTKPKEVNDAANQSPTAQPKPILKKQSSDVSSSTTSVKSVNPSRLSRQMLKLLGKTREIKARNYRPDAPYHKRRSSRRALASQEQEESAACKKCWRMSKRLMINRKKRRNARIMLEKFRDKAMGYDELERKLEKKDRRIAELEKQSTDNSKSQKMKEEMREKDKRIADLEVELKKSRERVQKLEKDQKKNRSSAKPTTSSSSSQTGPLENRLACNAPNQNAPGLAEQDVDQIQMMREMKQEMERMRKMVEVYQKEHDESRRSLPLPTVTNADATISLLKEQKEILVKQTVEKDVELCKLNLELEKFRAAGMTYAEVEALKESKIEFMKEIEDLRKDNAITKEINTRHENTIRELVAMNFEQ